MALRYSFRQLFFKKVLRPKRLYKILEDLDSAVSEAGGTPYDDTEVKADIGALETAIGDESTEGTILARIKALEDSQ